MKINRLCRVGGRAAVIAATWLCVACGGGGGDGASPVPNSTNSSFVNWTNSANGTVVKDWANHDFQVRSSDRTIVDASGTAYHGAIVDSSAKVILNGTAIGSVSVMRSSTGTQIAVFTCTDSSGLVWGTTNGSYSYNCMSTSSNSGNSGAGNSVSQATPNDSYINYTNSANGAVVVDASNQRFRVRASDGAVVDDGNAVLNGTSVQHTTLTINGATVASVSLVNGSGGSKIGAFVCPSGDLLSFTLSATSYSWHCPSSNSSNSSSGSTSGNTGDSTDTGGESNNTNGSSNGNTTGSAPAGTLDFQVLSNTCAGDTCTTSIANTGTVGMSCIVNYHYSYPNGQVGFAAGFDSDSVAESTGYVRAGDTGSARLEPENANFILNSYNVSCTKWPFE